MKELGIVMSVGVDGATVTQVAQRHDVTWQQIYVWRHELKRKGLWSLTDSALFFPVDFPSAHGLPGTPESSPITSPTPVELRLQGGRCLCFDSTMDAAALTQLIRAVEAA